MYNPKYIVNGQMWQYRGPKGPAIHTFFTADGTAIGMFQGSRGVRPDLDFKVKILVTILFSATTILSAVFQPIK